MRAAVATWVVVVVVVVVVGLALGPAHLYRDTPAGCELDEGQAQPGGSVVVDYYGDRYFCDPV